MKWIAVTPSAILLIQTVMTRPVFIFKNEWRRNLPFNTTFLFSKHYFTGHNAMRLCIYQHFVLHLCLKGDRKYCKFVVEV